MTQHNEAAGSEQLHKPLRWRDVDMNPLLARVKGGMRHNSVETTG